MNTQNLQIKFDVPSSIEQALSDDKLSRQGFAEIAANALTTKPESAGFVVSIEGAWGSGKTTTSTMIQAVLKKEENPPIFIHFNPWLVGEKDALLRQFLSSIAKAIKLSDHSQDGKNVAKEINAYAKVFDLVKLIPGAEPWASLVKSVIVSAGEATGSVAEYKTPNIEAFKHKVEAALLRFNRPIFIFIDDIDRLFPQEIFEMVRIIKSVGGLPCLRYLVAWDSAYVCSALGKLGIPYAENYLDKIVQVRMPLPSLSKQARRRLVNDALGEMDSEALRVRFGGEEQRVAYLYQSGLRDLLEQPRDIVRVFNAVRMMEPLLRGEIVFSDILGLAALSVKAPSVFDLLRKRPQIFVGRTSNEDGFTEKSEAFIEKGSPERDSAYLASDSPVGVRRMIHFLFPMIAKADDTYSLGTTSYADGTISHHARLAVALQLHVADGDVSIDAVRRYLQVPTQRISIEKSLSSGNCNEFLESLEEVGKSLRGEGIGDVKALCMAIARLPDSSLFVDRSRSARDSLSLKTELSSIQAIDSIVATTDATMMVEIAGAIALDQASLSCAAEIISQSYVEGRSRHGQQLILPSSKRNEIVRAFSENVLIAAISSLYEKNSPGFILWTLARLSRDTGPQVYASLKKHDPTLDNFALHFLGSSWDSSKGVSYSFPQDRDLLAAYCPIEEFKAHAAARLKDTRLNYPALAAWRSVVEEKSLYGIDGSESRH